ncbi:ribonuclease H-like domain-containing protein [Tanacetum coccineum]
MHLSKTPSTKDTSSSSIDYIAKSPTSSTSLLPNGYLNPPTSPPLRVSPPPLTQENTSMDITLTLSPITPLDVQFDSLSPSLPIVGHPIPWNLLEAHGDSCLLPSSVLNGKSPFELVYKRKRNLSHLRPFGCLYFSSVLNNHDNLSFSPNDDEKDSSVEEGSLPHSGESDSTKGRYQNDRHSATQSKPPVRLNDYVVSSNVKYGIEKYVNSYKLNRINLCSATNLNKSVEPTCLSEPMSYRNWIEAINNEIEAFNRNSTWTICDLPIGRKPIGRFDYDEIFSPVVKMVTVRCLIAIVVVNNWPLYQLDVNNAFLYSDLIEYVYMTLPNGYNDENNSKVCKLNKSLYGLNQALRQWNAKLTTALAEHGFERSKFDYSLYTKQNGNKFVALLVYVDDIVITRNDDVRIKEFKRKYCLELLHKYGLLAARHVDIPLPENSIISFKETNNDNQHMHNPLQSHFKAALRVLRYLKDWAKCLKIRRSVTGFCVFRGKTLVSWKSKKQAMIFKSSSEAEYRSMSSASCEVVWLGNLLHNIGLKDLYPIELFCDNSSAIHIATNHVFHERTKHFELDVNYIREKVLAGIIKTMKVSSDLRLSWKDLGRKRHVSKNSKKSSSSSA